jgi:hypothetical protein
MLDQLFAHFGENVTGCGETEGELAEDIVLALLLKT